MFARIASIFWPSKRSARNRIVGWGALALFFCLWALCGHELSIAAIALYFPLPVALYNVFIWWLRGYLDHRLLSQAYAGNDYIPTAPTPMRPRGLRVPPKLD